MCCLVIPLLQRRRATDRGSRWPVNRAPVLRHCRSRSQAPRRLVGAQRDVNCQIGGCRLRLTAIQTTRLGAMARGKRHVGEDRPLPTTERTNATVSAATNSSTVAFQASFETVANYLMSYLRDR